MKLKDLSLSLLSTLLCILIPGISIHAHDQISAFTIGNILLQSEAPLTMRKVNFVPTRAQDHIQNPETTNLQDVDLSIKTPSKFDQTRRCFQLLYEMNPKEQPTTLLDLQAIKSLTLIAGEQGEKTVLNLLSTHTIFGKAAAATMLAQPLTKQELITQRQTIVRAIAQNKHLKTCIADSLNQISAQEPYFFALFEPMESFTKKQFDALYYTATTLNHWNKHVYAIALLRSYQALYTNPKYSLIRILAGDLYAEASSHLADHINNCLPKDLQIHIVKTERGKHIYRIAGIITAVFAEMIHLSYRQTQVHINQAIIEHMYKKLEAVAKLIKALEVLADNTRAIAPEYAQQIDRVLQSSDPALQQLLQLLAQIRTEGSSFFHTSRILVAYKLLEELKDQLVPALEAAGKIDAFYAAAQLIDQGFCFAQFAEEPTTLLSELPTSPACSSEFTERSNKLRRTSLRPGPTIICKAMRNPLMPQVQAVTNDVTLAQPDSPHLIITGPSGSGKSFYMNAIARNIIFIQTFGICAAEEAYITVFKNMYVYLNIQEKPDASLSTFMAEVKKLEEICRAVEAQPHNEPCFVLIDEALKGGIEQTGGLKLYDTALRLHAHKNIITIIATHFKKPTELEAVTQGAFANYHVDLQEPTTGEFIRTFKLIPGTNSWWFNDALKRDRFITWLTTVAMASNPGLPA